jgi:DNA-directed RNA polymerase beta' subunit
MLSANNILSPAHGDALATPTQDMVLGAYYLTYSDRDLNAVAVESSRGVASARRRRSVRRRGEAGRLQQPIEYLGRTPSSRRRAA